MLEFHAKRADDTGMKAALKVVSLLAESAPRPNECQFCEAISRDQALR